MRRPLMIGLGVLILLLVLSQVLLPLFLENRVEDRLTKNGGSAEVTLKALPALTLLGSSGSEAKVRGHGLTLDLNGGANGKPLDKLDGFGKVDVDVTSSTAGPFHVRDLSLRRGSRADPYETSLDATVTGRELATYAGGQVAGGFGDFLGSLAAGAVPFSTTPIPVLVNATLASDGGAARIVSVSGSIGGLPAGPLLETLAEALGRRF
jgi:hypothetical protein